MLTTLGTTALLVIIPVAANAEDFPDPGFDDGSFGDPGMDAGIPGWFFALFVLVLVGGVAASLYRISSARRMATRAGLDPDEAARVTMLSEDGYGATYLASQLRSRPDASAGTSEPRPTSERLRELESLRSDGLVTDEEHAARRAAILEDL
jgi:hypothetical protein